MPLDALTRLNMVIGHPTSHSQSPAMHEAIYHEFGINAVMLAVDNPTLTQYMQCIRTLSIGLTAVTLPFKTAVLDYVDSQSDDVKALKAANTLLLKNGKIHAENTDVHGIEQALIHTDLNNKHILILGAGGAARAVGFALSRKNATLYWLNRTPSHAEVLAQQWGGRLIESDQLAFIHIDIIINTTPVGMSPNIEQTPLPGYAFQAYQTVFDLIYTPEETVLLREARAQGAHCISGMVMFIAQARRQADLYRINIRTEAVLS